MKRGLSHAGVFLALAAVLAAAAAADAKPDRSGPYELLPTRVIVDKHAQSASGGDPGAPLATTESKQFSLSGKYFWPEEADLPAGLPADTYSDSVAYTLTSADGPVPPAFQPAVESAGETLDAFVSTRNWVRNDSNPTTNPCGGVNQVEWGPIDGPLNIGAIAYTCPVEDARHQRKFIVGFRIQFDSAEDWSTAPTSEQGDVETFGAHEFGHVAGLGHVGSTAAGCLTMYPFLDAGTTYKRALGWGDKIGLSKLYTVPNTNPRGSCGP